MEVGVLLCGNKEEISSREERVNQNRKLLLSFPCLLHLSIVYIITCAVRIL